MSDSVFNLDRILEESFVQRVEHHAELPSTNDLALRLAVAEGSEWPLLVVAERQTAGRGRTVNRWWAAEGAITFSLVMDAGAQWPQTEWPKLSLVTALAIRAALSAATPQRRVQVKWPNDVYLDDKKISGILIEAPSNAAGRLVVGIGVNANNSLQTAPEEIQLIATALCDVTGEKFDLTNLLLAILRQIENAWLAMRANRENYLAETWQPHCWLSGRHVEIESGGRRLLGRCDGIDSDGALRLLTESSLQRIHSGVVRVIS